MKPTNGNLPQNQSENSYHKWYQSNGEKGDVVISTRIRFARNFSDIPFPNQMNRDERLHVINRTKEAVAALQKSKTGQFSDDFDFLQMDNMLTRDALSMVERHVISPDFAMKNDDRALIINKDESISIMVNEEDHVRVQVMSAGYDLDNLYQKAGEIETALESKLNFAFDNNLGYLTQCPTNLGTGMRASLMLHLPALQEHGAINRLANTVSKLGLTIRGMYGEGSKSEGAIFQLSNQITLGISEQSAIDNLKGIANQIIKEERTARDKISGNIKMEDLAWRSLGILRTARILGQSEFMTLISNVRIGISLGVLTEVSLDTVNTLLCDAQPSSIMSVNRKDMEEDDINIYRATMVRESLKPQN